MTTRLARARTIVVVCLSTVAISCGDDGTPAGGGQGGESTDGHGGGGNGQTGGGGQANGGAAQGGGGAQSTGGNGGDGGAATGGNGTGGDATGGGATGGNGSGGNGTGGGATGGNGSGGNGNGGNASGGNGTGGSATGGNGTGGAGGDGGAGGNGPDCDDPGDCDDGVFCNGPESCVNGSCSNGTPPCDDDVSCTLDLCDENTTSCNNMPTTICDDGVACNGVETCDPNSGCVQGTPLNCDDNIACTADLCDPATDSCIHTPQSCSDGNVCNGVETCDVNLGCLAGTPLNCNDGIGCTTDSCSELQGGCVHAPSNAACNNGDFCDGVETCSTTLGCVSGAPPNCNDGVDCTNDSCSSALNACVNATNNAFCNDGFVCNGVESCNATQGCVTTGPIVCPSDGVACTVEACNEALGGQCESTPDNDLCSGGDFCTAGVGCTDAPPCDDDAECDDLDDCNGVETCEGVIVGVPNSGNCAAGNPVVCEDNVDCTFNVCNPATGACSFTPSNVACDDGQACNGVETCNATLGCISGAPIDCQDGVGCTVDSCVEPGICETFYNDAQCADANQCNGAERCTDTGCVAGPPLVCPSDGIACTTESCNPSQGCVSTPNNAACPCGQTCDPNQGGCGNFCLVAECQGHVYRCGDCIDNDGDCRIDSDDNQCLGACDHTEDSLYGGIPGQNNSPCKSDCYFDQDTGSGNDDCYWSHKCDPREVPPNYPPEGSQCEYNPNANIPGYSGTCANAFATQSQECEDYCGPLTPNGCDCFGCCVIPGAPTPVWLGSTVNNAGSCTLADLANPARCKPCTQVAACINTCDNCEICIGKPTLPPECTVQECDNGAQPCGQANQPDCPAGFFCITGCCQPTPG